MLVLFILAGLCYSEFRSHLPRVQGTAYEYMYCIGGEALAFLIGWSLIIYHVTFTSTIARGLSQNFDAMLNFRLLNMTITSVGSIDSINSHIDFVGFFVVFFMMAVVASGMKTPTKMMNTVIHGGVCLVLIFVLVVGAYKVDFALWKDSSVFFYGGTEGVSIFCVVLRR